MACRLLQLQMRAEKTKIGYVMADLGHVKPLLKAKSQNGLIKMANLPISCPRPQLGQSGLKEGLVLLSSSRMSHQMAYRAAWCPQQA